jgi:hypothetical protein
MILRCSPGVTSAYMLSGGDPASEAIVGRGRPTFLIGINTAARRLVDEIVDDAGEIVNTRFQTLSPQDYRFGARAGEFPLPGVRQSS